MGAAKMKWLLKVFNRLVRTEKIFFCNENAQINLSLKNPDLKLCFFLHPNECLSILN